MRARSLSLSVMVLASVGLVGCGPAPRPNVDAGVVSKNPCGQGAFTVNGGTSTSVDAGLSSGVFVVPVGVGPATNVAVVDTGAPVTIVDPSLFSGAALPTGQGVGPAVTVGGLTVTDESVVGAPVGASLATGPVPMLMGGDFLCHFTTSFDYRAPRVYLGVPSEWPASLATAQSTDIAIEGGGLGAIMLGGQTSFISTPATRIAVTALVEGVERHFILDSGASFAIVSDAVFTALTADGRKTLSGLGASTVMGMTGIRTTRAKSFSVGGAEVQGVLVAGLDSNIWPALSAEVGHPVDGLLGGSWLREFLVTVDYDQNLLTLRKYQTRDHIHDELTRLGFALRARANGDYEVAAVFADSDAAHQALAVGTLVVSIDGTALNGLSPQAVESLCLGEVGTTRSVKTDSATLAVKVEDLLASH